LNRAASGFVGHRISRPVNDSHYIVVELDFDELHQAQQLLANLQAKVWNPDLRPGGTPSS
jgi:tyrosine-protein phosphatase YwqE